MSQFWFSKDHEWMREETAGIATVGITEYAAQQLGDVVFIELPEIGKTVSSGNVLAVIESVKAAVEVYAPVSGEVVAINDRLVDEPELANKDPRNQGWFLKLRIANPAELNGLMDDEAYAKYIAGL